VVSACFLSVTSVTLNIGLTKCMMFSFVSANRP
jgi:hypothetical protein